MNGANTFIEYCSTFTTSTLIELFLGKLKRLEIIFDNIEF